MFYSTAEQTSWRHIRRYLTTYLKRPAGSVIYISQIRVAQTIITISIVWIWLVRTRNAPAQEVLAVATSLIQEDLVREVDESYFSAFR